MYEALLLIPTTAKTGVRAHACNISSPEEEAGTQEGHSESKVSLGYVRPFQTNKHYKVKCDGAKIHFPLY